MGFTAPMPRLFVALRPPSDVRDLLIDTMEPPAAARWQDEDQLHLTLRFIGEVDRRQAEDIAAALGRVPLRPFRVEIAGTGHFARGHQPNAIWARVLPSPELAALRTSVERACLAAGLPPETRAFTPHITIARLTRVSPPVGQWLARHADLKAAWQTEHFALYESHLTPAGAAYEEVARFPQRDR